MPDQLPPDIRTRLLEHARDTLRAVAEGRPAGDAPRGGVLDEPAAVFVTLRRGDALRGCLGRTAPHAPLGEAVREMTVDAATQDPRFPPVRADEVSQIDIEISRLTPPRPATPDEIVVGRHGVVIRSGARIGLLLPQVATEMGCGATEFLELACRKAGLGPSAWRDEGVSISVFEAEVFGE